MYLSVFLNRFTDCHTMKNTERIMATIPINMENPQSLCRPHFMSISITFPELKFHVPLAPSKQWPSNSCKFIETGIKMKKDPRNDTKNAITWDKRSMFPIPMVVQILSVTFNASSFIPPSYILLLRLHWLAQKFWSKHWRVPQLLLPVKYENVAYVWRRSQRRNRGASG